MHHKQAALRTSRSQHIINVFEGEQYNKKTHFVRLVRGK